MKNEFQKHKKSDSVKWVFTLISFLLVFAFIVGFCMQLFAKDEYKPSNWFNRNCEHIYEDGTCTKCGALEIETTVTPAKSVALSMTKAVSTNDYLDAYFLCVECEPYYASVSNGNLVLSWANSNSSWAQGKSVSDYVVYEKYGEGSYYIYFKKNFAETIIATYTIEGKKTLTATRRIECVGSPYCFWNGDRKSVDSIDEIVYLDNFLVDNGTIAPDFICGEVYVEFDSSDILDYLWEKGHYSITGEAEYSPMYGYSFSASNYESYITIESILNRMCDEEMGEDTAENSVIYDIAKYFRENGYSIYDIFVVSFEADCSYQGTDYGYLDDSNCLGLTENAIREILGEV